MVVSPEFAIHLGANLVLDRLGDSLSVVAVARAQCAPWPSSSRRAARRLWLRLGRARVRSATARAADGPQVAGGTDERTVGEHVPLQLRGRDGVAAPGKRVAQLVGRQ